MVLEHGMHSTNVAQNKIVKQCLESIAKSSECAVSSEKSQLLIMIILQDHNSTDTVSATEPQLLQLTSHDGTQKSSLSHTCTQVLFNWSFSRLSPQI